MREIGRIEEQKEETLPMADRLERAMRLSFRKLDGAALVLLLLAAKFAAPAFLFNYLTGEVVRRSSFENYADFRWFSQRILTDTVIGSVIFLASMTCTAIGLLRGETASRRLTLVVLTIQLAWIIFCWCNHRLNI